MARPLLRERARYWFDNTMSRGTSALIGWLALASVVLIVAGGALVALLTPNEDEVEGGGFGSAIWETLLRAVDSGSIGNQGTPLYLALMSAVTLGGILIVSTLVGVLATGMSDKLADLRKGRSHVLEQGHTVILGWSEQIYTIIGELIRANEGHRASVVILASRDKVEMEEEIRAHLGKTGRLRIICRTGNPAEPSDLPIARPDQASVILIPSCPSDKPDITLIKTLLSLQHHPWDKGIPPVVAIVNDSSNLPAAILAGGPTATLIDAEDFTARLVVQSRRHPGLSLVCTDLLSYEGNEIYMRLEPTLVGQTYTQALFAYETATVIGLKHPDGTLSLNPPSTTVIGAADEVILIAPSLAAVQLNDEHSPIHTNAIQTHARAGAPAERTLLLGWNDRGPTILRLLDQYLADGSTVTVASTRNVHPGLFAHLTVDTVVCDPTSRHALDALEPGKYDHVVVLSADEFGQQDADARTLVTLLHLRDRKENGGDAYTIVSEINVDANRRLAQVTRTDDFVVSNMLISLLMTQLSQNPHLRGVFADLFEPRGSDLFLKPAADYVAEDTETNFATVVEAARLRGETAIGYRLESQSKVPPAFGLVLNPDKHLPLRLESRDRVVVLAAE